MRYLWPDLLDNVMAVRVGRTGAAHGAPGYAALAVEPSRSLLHAKAAAAEQGPALTSALGPAWPRDSPPRGAPAPGPSSSGARHGTPRAVRFWQVAAALARLGGGTFAPPLSLRSASAAPSPSATPPRRPRAARATHAPADSARGEEGEKRVLMLVLTEPSPSLPSSSSSPQILATQNNAAGAFVDVFGIFRPRDH